MGDYINLNSRLRFSYGKPLGGKNYLLQLVCLALIFGGIITVKGQTTDAGAVYNLRNQCSSRMLDVDGASRQKGA